MNPVDLTLPSRVGSPLRDQLARVHHPRWVGSFGDGLQHGGARSALLPYKVGCEVGADPVVVGKGSPPVQEYLYGCCPESPPALQGGVGIGGQPEEEGEVEGGPCGIDVRSVDHGDDPLLPQSRAQGLKNRSRGGGEIAPGGGGLDSVRRPSTLPECVTQVG